MLALTTAFSVALQACCDAAQIPEQMHIALAGTNCVRVMWFTPEETASVCRYGKEPASLFDSVEGSQVIYLAEHGAHHSAKLSQLDQDAQYFYSCGNGETMSDVFSFHTTPSGGATKPVSFAIFGDWG